MKKRIVIEPHTDDYDSVTFYHIRFEEEDRCEFDKFFEKFDTEEFENDFDVIIEWLNQIGDDGALDDHFRDEGGEHLKAIPIETNELRLYCFKVNDCILILGNGGVKNTRTYQEDPILNEYVSHLRQVGFHLFKRAEKSDRAGIYNCTLFGDLKFEIEVMEVINEKE